jgi:uncharacterized delta-60 repeat protein
VALRRLAFVVVVVSTLSAIVCVVAIAAPGDLDRTFSGDGKVTTSFNSGWAGAGGVAIQADGKIVVAGSTGFSGPDSRFAVARYGPYGRLDPTFGGDGRVRVNFSSNNDLASAVAVQSDGKIVAVGTTTTTTDSFALARFNTDGSLDTTFDGDGKLITEFPDPYNWSAASSVVIQSDGKIVVAGRAWNEEEEIGTKFALARYNEDGTLDTTFSDDGTVVVGVSTYDFQADFAADVAIDADGKIVAAGRADRSGFAVARFNADGTLDPTFSGDGKVTTDFGGNAWAAGVAIQGDGKIVAAGRAGGTLGRFGLARYNADGTLDPTFGDGGKVATDFSARQDYARGVAIQATGKIVAVGLANPGRDSRFALARYTADGTLDATFGGDGRVTTNFTTEHEGATEVAIEASGKIVAVGSAGQTHARFAVARYRSGRLP